MEAYPLEKTNTPHAFISYRRDDAAAVDELVSALGDAYPTWRDTSEIRGGQRWREQIVRGIDHAYAVILVVSRTTEHSKEVYAEYFYALGHTLPVIPLLVEDCELPFGLDSLNARNWNQQREQALRQLKDDLDHYRDESASIVPASAVETYLNSMKLDYLINVGNYTPMLGEVRKRHREQAYDGPLCPVEMRSQFSVQRLRQLLDVDGDRTEQIKEEVLDHQELLPSLHELHQVVLLGEPGIGKTTTLYKFADELRQRCLRDNDAPLPVILPLREWKGKTDLESFVKAHLGGLADQYGSLTTARRLYLLCDGLNEIKRDTLREGRVDALRELIDTKVPVVVTCRELDYRDTVLRLEMDTITMHPLEPSRILDFLTRYLVSSHGENEGRSAAEKLFWQIAGGDDIRALWHNWLQVGATLEQFFQASEIPHESPDVYYATDGSDDRLWYERVCTSANLIHLAANPYMLWMFLNVYQAEGDIPNNRGRVLHVFVLLLLEREGRIKNSRPTTEGQQLLDRTEELAWQMQHQAVTDEQADGGVELTLPRADALALLGGEQALYRAASANLLEDAEPVRFTHQLLQEYFSARRLLTEITNGLSPEAFWPPEHWWQVSGWEEATILAAGLSAEAAAQVYQWVLSTNPEVAAACIQRSGIAFDDEARPLLRVHWLDAMTDHKAQPEPVRAAIGRVLGSVFLSTGEALDNRRGVGLGANGVPDIDWVHIKGGHVVLEDEAGERTLPAFEIAHYPVTHGQFQAFIDAEDGYRNPDWWQAMPEDANNGPQAPDWQESNSPRETVSWYEAVAFCNWLSTRLGYTVRLPTEFEWQRAATGCDAQREYPWGEWKQGSCNSVESGLERTSAVGLYPQGTWLDGPLDMAGNVWEWCLNKYDTPKDNQIDRSGVYRVLRGGSWGSFRDVCRAGSRFSRDPGYRNDAVGFRLLRPPSSEH